MRICHGRSLRALTIAAVLSLSAHGLARAVTYNLRADTGSVTMPDGRVVAVWGFALGIDPVRVPGPTLEVPAGDSTLVIHLTNMLARPVSLVVAGLPATLTPVFDSGTPARVVSFTHEAAPAGGTATYTFSNVHPGTFLYESGTDPSLEVQMGLFGAIVARPTVAGRAYGTVATAYDREIVMVVSEIDPTFHDTVAQGKYAPEKTPETALPGEVTSTIDYHPKYFLVNDRPYTDPYAPFSGGRAGETTLIRLLNAGLQSHSMEMQGTRMDVIAQDGNLLGHPRAGRVSESLEAGQTLDILIRPTLAGLYSLYDRRLNVTNAGAFPGGILAFIEVSPASGKVVKAHVEANGPARYCEGRVLRLDASRSTVLGCASSPIYQWSLAGAPIAAATAVFHDVAQPAGSYLYTVDVTCPDGPPMTDTLTPPAVLEVVPDVAPPAVTGLSMARKVYGILSDSRDGLVIGWDPAVGAVSYTIFISVSPSGPWSAYASNVQTIPAVVPVPSGTAYFRVAAVNFCGTVGP